MSRRSALVGIPLLMVLTATASGCAGTGAGTGADSARDDAGAPAASPGAGQAVFAARAEGVAEQWRTSRAVELWRTGFVPLQPLTLPPTNATFNEATKQAFVAGWYRLDVGMPRERGGKTGTIRYADGATETVPVVSLAEAYAALDQGDPPPCPGFSVPPPADAPAVQDNTGPDQPVGDGAGKPCTALTVTSVRLGTAKVLTSRGEADAPAWLFTVRELGGQVARVAVAPSAVATPPELNPAGLPPADGVVSAQDLTGVTGTRLAFRLGVGACDENIKPLVHETKDVVVVGGTVTRKDGVCTEQMLFHPVTVTLDGPLDGRPVVDAMTAQVLTMSPVPGN